MMRILVTGACGYLGSVLCPELEAAGHEVVRFDKVLGHDISGMSQVRKASEGADLAVHLAAVVGLADVSRDVDLAFRVNVVGTFNLISCNVRTIFAGVLGGYPQGIRVTEETLAFPETPYYYQKTLAEAMVLSRDKNISLRFGTMYGVSPAMRWNLLIHDFVRQAVAMGCISLFEPEAVRPITNVRDAVRAILFLVERPEAGAYNVVSLNATKGELARRVQRVTGCQIADVGGRDPEARNYSVSTGKLRRLGFHFRPDLRRSIEEAYRKIEKDLESWTLTFQL